MKTLLRWVVAIVALSGGVASAQDLAGQWQGVLQAGRDIRIVITIARADDGLRAVLYNIDAGGQGVPATVTVQGSTVRMALAGLNATLEGTLSANGATLAGTWSQGGNGIPLTLQRAATDTAWAIPEPPKPMAADAKAVFEVATIKLSSPNQPGKLFTVRGRQVLTINTTLSDLITFAYGIHVRQITAGPDWMETQKYDVTGQPEAPGVPNLLQLRAMVRQLLTDRFTLTFHRDTRELPVYAIVVPPGVSPKLTKNDTNPNGLPGLLFRGLGVLPATNATIADLAGVMQTAVLDRPVVDKTGLQGRYDFTLRWTPDESQFAGLGVQVPPPSNDPNAPPGLFTAIQEQLGLKLDAAKAPVEVFVIDRVERPSEN